MDTKDIQEWKTLQDDAVREREFLQRMNDRLEVLQKTGCVGGDHDAPAVIDACLDRLRRFHSATRASMDSASMHVMGFTLYQCANECAAATRNPAALDKVHGLMKRRNALAEMLALRANFVCLLPLHIEDMGTVIEVAIGGDPTQAPIHADAIVSNIIIPYWYCSSAQRDALADLVAVLSAHAHDEMIEAFKRHPGDAEMTLRLLASKCA